MFRQFVNSYYLDCTEGSVTPQEGRFEMSGGASNILSSMTLPMLIEITPPPLMTVSVPLAPDITQPYLVTVSVLIAL